MKKVLILTISTGQGHNQAASSLAGIFEEKNYEVVKYDFLENNSRFLNSITVKGYEILASNFPKFYGFCYNLTDKHYIRPLARTFMTFTRKKLLNTIDELEPDVIIATHAFSTFLMEDLKSKGKVKIPYLLIVTDFKAHECYICKEVDAFITGSSYTKNTLIKKGINPDIIYPLGIPINQKFYTEKTGCESLKDKEYFNLLLMSGSLGLNQIFTVLKELVKNTNKLRITVVCGKNSRLRKSLLEYTEKNSFPDKKIHILGFTKDISYLMDYSDVIISKPGGLTVTEAVVKNIPLIIPFVIPGQEKENLDFLKEGGYSLSVDSMEELNPLIDRLIASPDEIAGLKSRLSELASSYSLDKITDVVENLIWENEKMH